jgi:hypothetical protein
MSSARSDLPTLTEIIDVPASIDDAYSPVAPMPMQSESVALESESLDSLRLREHEFDAPSVRETAPASFDKMSALAHDEELVAQVLVRLQPRLEAWVEAEVRRALMNLLPVWTESAALSIARDLRSEMPEMLSLALDEVHRLRRR